MTMEQILVDAKHLVHRLHLHDNAVDSLVGETTGLHGKLNAMTQYRASVSQLNEIGKQKPKSTLILGEQLENQRIRELELENRELQVSLAEHQSALVLIMKKYREQVVALLKANGLDRKIFDSVNAPLQDSEVFIDQLNEMKAIVKASIKIDDEADFKVMDLVHRLQCENRTLREVLNISQSSSATIRRKKELEEPIAREERKARKTLSLPLSNVAGPAGLKVANRLKFRSSAFSHKDASQLLFPGLSPVDKEFSPKSLGAWIKSEESSHKTESTKAFFGQSSGDIGMATQEEEDESSPGEQRVSVGTSDTPSTLNGHDVTVIPVDDSSKKNANEVEIVAENIPMAATEPAKPTEAEILANQSDIINSEAIKAGTRSTRKKSLSLDGDGGGQTIVFENANAAHDNDTIVYDISYELSGSDDDDDDETCYVDEDVAQRTGSHDEDSDSDEENNLQRIKEESALAELDLVVKEFDHRAGDTDPTQGDPPP